MARPSHVSRSVVTLHQKANGAGRDRGYVQRCYRPVRDRPWLGSSALSFRKARGVWIDSNPEASSYQTCCRLLRVFSPPRRPCVGVGLLREAGTFEARQGRRRRHLRQPELAEPLGHHTIVSGPTRAGGLLRSRPGWQSTAGDGPDWVGCVATTKETDKRASAAAR